MRADCFQLRLTLHRFLFAVSLLTTVCPGTAIAKNAPAPEVFAALPAFPEAALSQDGRRIAVLRYHRDGSSQVIVAEVDSGKLVRSVQTRAYPDFERRDRIDHIRWLDEERIGYVVNATIPLDRVSYKDAMTSPLEALEWSRMTIFNLRTGQSELVYQGGFIDRFLELDHLLAPIHADPGFGRALMETRPAGTLYRGRTPREMDGRFTSVYRVDLNTAKALTPLAIGNEDTVHFAITKSGDPGLRLDYDPVKETWAVFDVAPSATHRSQNHSRVLKGIEPDLIPWTMGYLDDARAILATRFNGNDLATFMAFEPGEARGETLAGAEGLDVVDGILDPWSQLIVGAAWSEDVWKQKFFDAALEKTRTQLVSLFPDHNLSITSWSQDRSRLIVQLEAPGGTASLQLFEPATGKLSLIGKAYPELDAPEFTGSRLRTHYPARDGTRIPAIVTLPAGELTGPRPLVVLQEGFGEWRSDTWFYWLAAYFASRGFVVIEPDIRGVVGYGRAWEDAANGRWLRIGTDDIEDAAKAMVAAGLAQTGSICGVGVREAGALIALAAARPASPFTCTITVNALLDLRSFWDTTQRELYRYSPSRYRQEIETRLGEDLSSGKRMREVSPLHQAGAIKHPVLVIGGLSTIRLRASQAQDFAKTVQKAGGDATLVDLNTGDHYLEEPATRLKVLEAMENYLHIIRPRTD